MRVILDECVDWRLSRDVVGHEVSTARQMGWSSLKNGELLTLAAQFLADLKPLVPQLLLAIGAARRGAAVVIGGPP